MRDGASHRGDPAVLDSYYCWNQPILSPAAGTVVSVENSLPDNPIGSTDPTHPAGNHVILDLGNGEFAFLGHMRKGSVAVAPGETVATGDPLGHCGNSGNTSEPHLHIHLQTTPNLADGEGLPAQFRNYRANGSEVDRGEPVAGQTIAPAGD
jgi:murein DD-endopeptidase MepM/ murein hydrolase activator NlpD